MSSKDTSKKNSQKKQRTSAPSFKRWFFLCGTLIVLGFGSLTFFGQHGTLELLKLNSYYHKVQEDTTALLQQQDELRAEILRLSDNRYVEYLARERLGLMRKNEVFIVLDTPTP